MPVVLLLLHQPRIDSAGFLAAVEPHTASCFLCLYAKPHILAPTKYVVRVRKPEISQKLNSINKNNPPIVIQRVRSAELCMLWLKMQG